MSPYTKGLYERMFSSLEKYTKVISKSVNNLEVQVELYCCTPGDFDSVPSNRVDISIDVRAPSAYTLRSICS